MHELMSRWERRRASNSLDEVMTESINININIIIIIIIVMNNNNNNNVCDCSEQ